MVLWVKAAHVVSIIAWMAAMLYLPRLMVYHAGAPVGSDTSETFKVMERRLLKAIATPAMIASLVFGIWLAFLIEAWDEGWLHAKLLFVLGLAGVHGIMARSVRAFAADRNERSARYYRIVNELPTVALVAIVILVVVKPF
jgi:protoporphyrinogen IX oxidase